MEIFERFRAQTRFIVTAEEYATLIAQMHRSIARNESRLEEQILPIVNIEKGITEVRCDLLIISFPVILLLILITGIMFMDNSDFSLFHENC